MTCAREPSEDGVANAGQRLDKWLWFARVIKTRTQAANLVTTGKVRINRIRVDKPSQVLRQGDVVTVTVRGHVRVLKVLAPGARRGPPAEARALFEDLLASTGAADAPLAPGTPPSEQPTQTSAQPGPPASGNDVPSARRDRGQGRPTKRERRQIDRLRDTEP